MDISKQKQDFVSHANVMKMELNQIHSVTSKLVPVNAKRILQDGPVTNVVLASLTSLAVKDVLVTLPVFTTIIQKYVAISMLAKNVHAR